MLAGGSRRILITGCTRGGLGWEAARQLLVQGHEVVLTLRDEAKAQDAVDALIKTTNSPRERVHAVTMDLGSFASVRAAGKQLLERFPSIDVLLLNAGVVESINSVPKATRDGYETTFQINHLSHFLLVHLVFPALLASKAAGGARIVAVASDLHRSLKDYPADPKLLQNMLEAQALGNASSLPKWTPLQSYSISKLYNIWFVYKLSKMCQDAKLPVTVDAVTPGWVPTSNLGLKHRTWYTFFMRIMLHYVMPMMGATVPLPEGARRLADVAAGAGALADGHEGDSVVFGTARYIRGGKPIPSSEASHDTAKQDELWAVSLKATGIAAESYLPRS